MNRASKRPSGLPREIYVSGSGDTWSKQAAERWCTEGWTAEEETAGDNKAAGGF